MTSYEASRRADKRKCRFVCLCAAAVLAAVALGWLWLLWCAVHAMASVFRV